MSDALLGKRVLVTGAATHTGLGIARHFARAGAIVAMNDCKRAELSAAAAALRAETGARILELPADISDVTQIAEMFARIEAALGGLDVLVNNAAHLGIGPDFLQAPLELLDAVLAVNLRGTYAVTQSAARLMAKAGKGGSIVFIGSNTSTAAIRARSAYCASKGALDALTHSLALDLGPHAIRVNMVVAGYIHTTRWDGLAPQQVERRRANLPLGREAHADDIAAACAYFASDASRAVTGARLAVDGGISSQMVPRDCEV